MSQVMMLSLLVLFAVALVVGFYMYKKDGFCRCNSLGGRVMRPDNEDANKMYVDGTLTENNF